MLRLDGDTDANNVGRWRGSIGVQIPKVCSYILPRQCHTPVFQETTQASSSTSTYARRSAGKYNTENMPYSFFKVVGEARNVVEILNPDIAKAFGHL